MLVAGTNTVTLRSVNNTGPNIDQLEVLVATPVAAPYAYYEAENAQLIGGPDIVPTTEDNRNAEGTGYVDFVGSTTQSIAWSVTVAEAGVYEVGIRYSLSATKAARPATLTIDGADPHVLPFEGFSNAAENEWRYETVSVQLQAGVNVLSLTAPNANGANIDQLRVATSPSAPAFDADYAEVDGSLRIELEQTADNSTRTVEQPVGRVLPQGGGQRTLRARRRRQRRRAERPGPHLLRQRRAGRADRPSPASAMPASGACWSN